ncbi:putative auxin-responsive protein IAA29 [Panicum miliaceum]|uniref:Auxin-responsive protein n=1 Tax=Panicum miliaceum TaxID=4540 RepID=A0A3L6Q5A3_PANMI|nr:putative auxin-responsive protein IAA29 [Panicum miliaceum]
MRSTDTCVEREVEARPRLSSSRFVKVFMQGGVVGRKINLATHQNYASLSFTLKRLGNNYSMPSCELNGLINNEDDGSLDDNNDFILFYDTVDGDRFFLGVVPWEVFIISVKRIYIVPIPREEENVADNEEEEEDRENGDDIAATSAAPPEGDDIPANDDEVADDGDATTASTPADGAYEE